MAKAYSQEVDIAIIGGGISGIGAACRVQMACPGKSYVVLESREDIGGTWDFFKYPGIRSDSDMFTFGYAFNPWPKDKVLASAADIKAYLKDTAMKFGVLENIKTSTRVSHASWSSLENRWTLRVPTGEIKCRFVVMASGYYKYDDGFTPDFAGMDSFKGRIVHPQKWDEDIDVTGQRVAVIGSGATAITLIPELAKSAAMVTCVQRSPSYIMSIPSKQVLMQMLSGLPRHLVYPVARAYQLVFFGWGFYTVCKTFPNTMRRGIEYLTDRQLPKDMDRKHFRPRYNPWDQRVCACPGGDLFQELRRGRATMVTAEIECFTETGLVMKSGECVPADVIVTATGFNLHENWPMSDIQVDVDGVKYEAPKSLIYRSAMLASVPNFVFIAGLQDIAISWTMKSDLACSFFCRLVRHMDSSGYASARPKPPSNVTTKTWDLMSSSYFARGAGGLPKVGTSGPWAVTPSFWANRRTWLYCDLDEDMEWGKAPPHSRL